MRPGVALPALLLLAACSSDPVVSEGVSGSGACAAPVPVLSADRLRPGDTVTVRIAGLVEGCADGTGGDVEAAVRAAEVWFHQAGHDARLATLTPDPVTGDGRVEVTVPADAVPGPADIAVGSSATAGFTVLGP